MVEFKSSELSARNYKEGDSVFVKYVIKRKDDKNKEIWLYCEENNGASLWINSDESILHGDAYKFRDGDIVIYDGMSGKIVEGFDNAWYVLTVSNELFDLDPNLIEIPLVIENNNVL